MLHMLHTTLHRHSLGSCPRRNRPAHAQQQGRPSHVQSSQRLASALLSTVANTTLPPLIATRRRLGGPAHAAASTTPTSSSTSSSSMAASQGSNGTTSGALAAAFARLQNGSDIRGVAMAREWQRVGVRGQQQQQPTCSWNLGGMCCMEVTWMVNFMPVG